MNCWFERSRSLSSSIPRYWYFLKVRFLFNSAASLGSVKSASACGEVWRQYAFPRSFGMLVLDIRHYRAALMSCFPVGSGLLVESNDLCECVPSAYIGLLRAILEHNSFMILHVLDVPSRPSYPLPPNFHHLSHALPGTARQCRDILPSESLRINSPS